MTKASNCCTNEPIFSMAHQQWHIFIILLFHPFSFILQISCGMHAVDVVTCELGALTTCGWIPDVGTVPVGGRFLLVTEAHEKVYEGCSKVLLGLPYPANSIWHFQYDVRVKYDFDIIKKFDNNRHGSDFLCLRYLRQTFCTVTGRVEGWKINLLRLLMEQYRHHVCKAVILLSKAEGRDTEIHLLTPPTFLLFRYSANPLCHNSSSMDSKCFCVPHNAMTM